MAFAEDLTEFFDTNDFAVEADITGINGTVNGIFDREYVEMGDIAGQRPVFTCAECDVANIVIGASVVIGATTYTFIDKIKEDLVISKLVLET